MAFTPFNFTKSWRNAADFPTFEPDEAKVRDDLQSLFDELKVGLNRLIGELKASNMPFTATAEIDSSDVQNAIENVQSQIASALLGQLPDGSVTSSKIADGSVDTGKIADGAITSAKLDDDAVTAAKLADDAVSTDSIADGAVTGEKIAEGTIGLSKLSSEALNAKADLVSGKVKPEQLSKARVNVTASRALDLTDDGKILHVSSTSAVVITIPLNSVAQLPVGSEIVIYRAGIGSVSIAGAEGVNITCSAALNSLERYDTTVLKKWGANDWGIEFNHNPIPAAGVTDNEIADGAITTSKILDGSVTSEKIAANAVSREKLNTDALYSPVVMLSSNVNLASSHLGKTLIGNYSSSSSTRTITLTQAISTSLPVGFEVAVCRPFNYSNVNISFNGLRLICNGTFMSTAANRTASLPELGTMIALKKIETHNTNGDLWLITGNVEVVS